MTTRRAFSVVTAGYKVISFTNTLLAICGEVGSGKSTLLATCLGEVSIIHGTVEVLGSIAYVSQSSWIQTGSIRDNILFGSHLDNSRCTNSYKLIRCKLIVILYEFSASKRRDASEKDILQTNDKKSQVSQGDQLINKEEREEGDTGFKPIYQYLT
ncbi:hypothetical protein LIER_34019 [Lithospermum erythrorhizon]|uniref:ABC transporter domain-containing protein n=1 Tax=Lithospermum erythrorhizon TaxID=34254 RepID=A0AAV3S3H6_LITER